VKVECANSAILDYKGSERGTANDRLSGYVPSLAADRTAPAEHGEIVTGKQPTTVPGSSRLP
jgi:hypothetical protein